MGRFKTSRSNSRKHTRGVVNIAVMESVCYFFARQTDGYLIHNGQIIQQNFDKLLQNASYIQSVRFSTGSLQQVRTRMELAAEILSMDTTRGLQRLLKTSNE